MSISYDLKNLTINVRDGAKLTHVSVSKNSLLFNGETTIVAIDNANDMDSGIKKKDVELEKIKLLVERENN